MTNRATGRDHLTEGGDLQRIDLSWLRNIARRTGERLALLALVVQIAVSFGHMHARDFASDIGSRAADGLHPTTAAKAIVSSLVDLAGDEDQCPICFSAFLLATSSVPQVEQPVAVLDLHNVSYAATRTLFGLLESGRASFQSRAPPAA
ncbi:hypothetical protein [Bradyrhizobium sp. STM 3557]|uniref:hypothetical protein n=1 Tax=Bradyrhizobium sp. STM 3557 TaxID=578920 RepID=UPI00388EB781